MAAVSPAELLLVGSPARVQPRLQTCCGWRLPLQQLLCCCRYKKLQLLLLPGGRAQRAVLCCLSQQEAAGRRGAAVAEHNAPQAVPFDLQIVCFAKAHCW